MAWIATRVMVLDKLGTIKAFFSQDSIDVFHLGIIA
jgi:hypothetical protein